ncbi:hypothetical protein ACI65C_004737 [Semiaphis heraclei]
MGRAAYKCCVKGCTNKVLINDISTTDTNDSPSIEGVTETINCSVNSVGMLKKIGIRHSKLLTPKCKSLYGIGVMMQKLLRTEKKKCQTFKDRLKAAEKFSDKYLDSKIIGCMTPAAAIFTKLQLRETKNSPKGRRFTHEEKLLCLSLYKQSTKSYRLLSKLFILPARKTLSTLLSQIPISTGLDKSLLKVLKEDVKTLKEKEKYCVVLFDEVSLEPQLQYDDNIGCIVGFEDNGLDRTQRFADHSLVFMIKGITKKFKQPISYTFCESSTKRYDLANQIRNVLKAVHLSGLKVVGTICDQGTTNTAAINILINDTKAFYLRQNQEYNDTFYEIDCGVERIKVVHLYDPPHLLKGIRNNLLNKNLMFTISGHQREACWKDIVDLYELDSVAQDVKMLPRLTREHVIPGEIKKMKVKNASQVFSHRVSSILSFLSSKNIMNQKAEDTAILCLFFDKLFDSVNGSYDKVVDGKIFRTAVKPNSPHHQLWRESLKVLDTMYFVNPVSKERSKPQPPTLKNWVKTIKGLPKYLNTFI